MGDRQALETGGLRLARRNKVRPEAEGGDKR
jgi:hypothetical protein